MFWMSLPTHKNTSPIRGVVHKVLLDVVMRIMTKENLGIAQLTCSKVGLIAMLDARKVEKHCRSRHIMSQAVAWQALIPFSDTRVLFGNQAMLSRTWMQRLSICAHCAWVTPLEGFDKVLCDVSKKSRVCEWPLITWSSEAPSASNQHGPSGVLVWHPALATPLGSAREWFVPACHPPTKWATWSTACARRNISGASRAYFCQASRLPITCVAALWNNIRRITSRWAPTMHAVGPMWWGPDILTAYCCHGLQEGWVL
jgi:hypothetical protein